LPLVSSQSKSRISGFRRKILLARERERHLVARELHDGVCQDFVGVKINLEGLISRLKRNRAMATSSSSQKLLYEIDRAIQDLRDSVQGLRNFMEELAIPAPQDDSLFDTLKVFFDRFSHKYKIKVQCSFPPKKYGFSRDKEIILFRIIQEAAVNVVKHARADHLWIKIFELKDRLLVAIKDNGVGLKKEKIRQKASAGLGLFFMQERCAYLGGRFAIHSKRGQGTHILLSLPVKKMH